MSMFNPHQNININISYNLGTDKPTKAVTGKKINKLQKPTAIHHPHCDIDIKLKHKNAQNNIKKANQNKSSTEVKKNNRKKNTSIHRNTITPDLFQDRRVKTEGPSAEADAVSTYKKENRPKLHQRSTQPTMTSKLGQSTKKIVLNKTSKSLKSGHTNSQITYNWKQAPILLGQHTISQAVSTGLKKKRASSSLIKNDKVVSKLLNMSVLASELGGSQPITSERRSNNSSISRNFKEYMSSVDMRIIKCMQDDVPIFATKQQSQQNIVKNIMRTKDISLQQLTRKVVTIQRAWKKKSISNVINAYKYIFQQAAQKLTKREKTSEDKLKKEQISLDSQLQFDMLTHAVQEQRGSHKNSFQGSSIDFQDQLRMIEEREIKDDFNQTHQPAGLNLSKYRQLVHEELSQQQQNKGKFQVKFKEEQMQTWNQINKKISSIMNDKFNVDSSTLMQQLIRQSDINKQWIQNQEHPQKQSVFTSQQKEQFAASLQSQSQYNQSHYNHSQYNQSQQNQSQFYQSQQNQSQFYQSQYNQFQYNQSNFNQSQQQYPCKQFNNYQLDNDSIDESLEYDKVKYGTGNTERQFHAVEQQEKQQSVNVSGNEKSVNVEAIWIGNQMMEDRVVKNYLDCGLDGFGLNINQRKGEGKNNLTEELDDDFNFSADQAIGAKFQKANIAFANSLQQNDYDFEPRLESKMDGAQIDRMVQGTIAFLISQFADISSILKKTTPSLQKSEKKNQPVNLPPCIQTNFNSIKQYISKLMDYICKDQQNIVRIIDNINRDIGPTSLEILTYLRPQYQDGQMQLLRQTQDQSIDDEEGLFVIPADLFELFQSQQELQYKRQHKQEMKPRYKAYLSFWHRCIFQSYNQCLDYQRPYGIQGKPYEWIMETKLYRPIQDKDLLLHMARAEARMTEQTSLVGGIIFQKPDSPFSGADLTEEQMHMMNEQRLSRILATQLLQSEQSWVNYNDEMAELLVQLSRLLQDRIFFQYGTELKKLQRRRKIIAEEAMIEESVAFNIQQL